MGVGVPEAVSQSWPAPNYAHPVRRGPELYIISSFFLLLAVMAVGVRLYTRIMVRRWVGPDDGLVIIALVSFLNLFFCVFFSILGHSGGGEGVVLVALGILWEMELRGRIGGCICSAPIFLFLGLYRLLFYFISSLVSTLTRAL